MDRPFDALAWQAFFQAVVAASAALLGLLFVSVSLRVSAVTDSPQHRARAREALGQLLVLLILGIMVLAPGQSRHALGIELIVYGVTVAVVTSALESGTLRRLRPAERRRWALQRLGFNIGVATLLIGGVSVEAGRYGGFYWFVVTTVVFFVWSALNAWLLLIHT
jgi:hypothetical protein